MTDRRQSTEPGKAQQPPHPLRCETCENKECEYWEVHPHMSARHDHDTGWTASPGVITFSKGCASHTSASQQRIDMLSELQMWRIRRMTGTLKKDVWIAWNEETDRINALLQAGDGK